MRLSQTPCVLAAALAITACATSVPYDSVLATWVGASEAELQSRWGAPARTEESAGRRFAIYVTDRTLHMPGTPSVVTDHGTIVGTPPMDVALRCTTTFELRDSAVVAATYAGDGCSSKTGGPARR